MTWKIKDFILDVFIDLLQLHILTAKTFPNKLYVICKRYHKELVTLNMEKGVKINAIVFFPQSYCLGTLTRCFRWFASFSLILKKILVLTYPGKILELKSELLTIFTIFHPLCEYDLLFESFQMPTRIKDFRLDLFDSILFSSITFSGWKSPLGKFIQSKYIFLFFCPNRKKRTEVIQGKWVVQRPIKNLFVVQLC